MSKDTLYIMDEDIPPLPIGKFKNFKKHFINQFRPREIWNSIKLHPYLILSFVVVLAIGILLIIKGLPQESIKNIFSLWTLITVGHLIQMMSGLCLPKEPRVKRFLKVPFHLLLAICSFLYWLKMGDWMHYGFHHFSYASILLYFTFERLGKSAAFVIGFPLAISDIVGYGEFPIFPKPENSSGLDNVLKDHPWVFLVPMGILFLCELLIEGPLVQTILDLRNIEKTEETEDLL